MLKRVQEIARGGAASVFTGLIATNLLRIVSSIVLTRLLDSTAYGVVGILTAVSVTISMLSDIGTFPFVVRHEQGDDPAFRDQIWSLRLLRGVVIAAIMVALSVPVSAFMQKPELAPVIALWSVSFVIDGLSSLAFATAVRERQLWRLSLLDLSQIVMQIVVSVILALLWRDYWAMVWAMLAGSATKALLSYLIFPRARRRFRLDRARGRELWRFSRYIAPSSMLSLLILQADKLFLGRVLPLETFGLYAVASTLALAPAAAAYPYATRVLFPAYAAAARQSGEALARIFYANRRKVACLYMFVVGGLIGGAPLVVEVMYDDRYRKVAPILSILAISVALQLNNWSADQALMALGRTRATLFANVTRVAWLGLGGAAGFLAFGPIGLIWVVGTVEAAGMLSYWWSIGRAGLFDLRQEALGFAAAGIGVAVGLGVSAAGLALTR